MTLQAAQTKLESIIGRPVELTRIRPIGHSGTGRIFRLTPRRGKLEYLLKIYEFGQALSDAQVASYTAYESTTLANIASVPASRFRRPAYFGSLDNAIVMEFVPGRLFEHIRNDSATPADEIWQIYTQAVETLAKVHGAIGEVEDAEKLLNRFSPDNLQRDLVRQAGNISTDGFATYVAKGLAVNPDWGQALADLPVARITDDLGVADSHPCFLSQGDFKPDNLLVTPDGQICVLDWTFGAKAQPWYDLAYLLLHVPAERWDGYTNLYLDEMHRAGHLADTSLQQSRRLLVSGALYQQMARVNANVKYLSLRDEPHHVQEFQAGLDGIVRLLASGRL